MAKAGKNVGLDWVTTTDHSDVYMFGKVRTYINNDIWNALQAEATNTQNNLGLPVLLGEEVTVGNGSDLETTGHFLAYDIFDRIGPLCQRPIKK